MSPDPSVSPADTPPTFPAVMLDTKEHERLVWAVGAACAVLADEEDTGQ